MRKTDIAYWAGFFDGEGCIGLDSNVRSIVLSVSIGQANPWLIQHLRFTFGGSVRRRPIGSCGNKRPFWVWRAHANQALSFLEIVYPFLKLKKQEAEIAINFQRNRRGKGCRMSEEERTIEEAQQFLVRRLKDKSSTGGSNDI